VRSPFHGTTTGWKIYCVVLGIAVAIIYGVVLSASFRPVHIVDLAITLPSFAGLCGYAFQKRVGWLGFWQIQCFLFPAWDVLFNFYLSPPGMDAFGLLEVLVLTLLFVPEYWALWAYGYRSPGIWKKAQ
jgi:hypothetical protein